MKKISQPLLLLVAIFIAIMPGCTYFKKVIPKEVISVLEDREDRFVKARLQKGREHEREGDRVEALKQYKIALTVDPSCQEAIEGVSRLEAVLKSSAGEHYKKGLEEKRQGKYAQARQQLLTSLRLRPDYSEALEMLTSLKEPQVKGYLVHKIQPGESLSQLAAVYYGDYRKFPIIASYNNLSDPAVVSVGQEIKIPEVDGMDLSAHKGYPKGGGAEDTGGPLQGKEDEPDLKPEAVDQVITYRELGLELFKEKRYEEALAEFNKVICTRPDDKVALEYSYQSCFEMAMDLYEKQDYLAARDQFRLALQYKNDCRRCNAYIKKSEELYKALHYKQGIRYYGREQLTEAIREWEMVRALDPSYKRVGYYINKAKEMLKRLEDLREELKEGSALPPVTSRKGIIGRLG
jgi:tetratricopeptide (TPR) repeat protein